MPVSNTNRRTPNVKIEKDKQVPSPSKPRANQQPETSKETDSHPLVPVIVEGRDQLTKKETILSKFFRCPDFPLSCHFHSNDSESFLDHLNDNHSFSRLKCGYCGSRSEIFPSPEALVQHMIVDHGRRRFQCNLCLYRCTRLLQIHIHQITCHSDNYQEVDFSLPTTPTDSNLQILLKKSSRQNSKETKPPCKIIVCENVVAGPLLHEAFIFAEKRFARKNHDTCKDMYQCAFCPVMEDEKEAILAHLSLVHPDLPLLIYPPSSDEKSKPTQAIKEDPAIEAKGKEPPSRIDHPSSNIPGLGDFDPSIRVHFPPKNPSIEYRPEDTLDYIVDKPSDWRDKEVDVSDVLNEDLDLSDEDIFAPEKSKKKDRADSDDSEEEMKMKEKPKRPDPRNVVQESQPIGKPIKANPNLSHKKCLLCVNTLILGSKVALHMRSVHNQDYTTQCSTCQLSASKNQLKEHIRKEHKGTGSIVTIMVSIEETEPNVLETFTAASASSRKTRSALEMKPLGKRKGSSSSPSTSGSNKKRKPSGPPEKGRLMKELKEATFLGPSKHQRTEKGQLVQSKKQGS